MATPLSASLKDSHVVAYFPEDGLPWGDIRLWHLVLMLSQALEQAGGYQTGLVEFDSIVPNANKFRRDQSQADLKIDVPCD